jgi:REP element-mobilizing transposase RayT
MPDHVHLLASLQKTRAVADDVRDTKANASGWIHDEFPALSHFAWQTRYAAFTVSLSNVPSLKEYFANQAEHHRKKTFQEEFLEFLEKHEIDFDPKYVFE